MIRRSVVSNYIIGWPKVGEKLYRVHKRVLVGSESSVFASMLSLQEWHYIEGQTDEKLIVLEGENPRQFEALMRILYPTK